MNVVATESIQVQNTVILVHNVHIDAISLNVDVVYRTIVAIGHWLLEEI